MNLMIADSDTPAEIRNGIINTRQACVALRFHGVTANGAGGGSSVASAHVDRIGSVAKMSSTSVGAAGRANVARCWRDR